MQVIIAGATQGIGLELTKFYSKDNKVLAIGRDLSKVSKNILGNSNIHWKECDLSDESAVQKHLSVFNTVDLLINCAATWTGGVKVKDMSLDFLKRSFDLNFVSAFNSIKYVLGLDSYSIERPLTIINLGATASMRGGSSTFAFALGKSSLRILTQSVAREMSEDGVHCCHLIIDGLIKNERTINLNPSLDLNRYIQMNSLVKTIDSIVKQPKDCWTLEMDLRPYNEKF